VIFTSEGVLSLRNSQFKDDFGKPDENCDCYTCQNHSRAYLRHLFNAGELLALNLASIHNLHFYIRLVKNAREQIIKGTFKDWKEKLVKLVSKKISLEE
jgi:queuine tRNA-ribosyltransferase